MTDCVRIQGGKAAEIFAGVTKAGLANRFTAEIVGGLIEVESGSVVEGQPWNGAAFDPLPGVDLVAYAALKRFSIETRGIALNGVAVATDRESQSMLTGAYNYLNLNQAATIKWKAETGFVELGLAQIEAIASAVGAHVQACFAKEADIVASIVAEDIVDVAGVDAAFAAL